MVTIVEKKFAKVIQTEKETYTDAFDRFYANYLALAGANADTSWFLENVSPLTHQKGSYPTWLEVGGDKYNLAVLFGVIDTSHKPRVHKVKVDDKTSASEEVELAS